VTAVLIDQHIAFRMLPYDAVRYRTSKFLYVTVRCRTVCERGFKFP